MDLSWYTSEYEGQCEVYAWDLTKDDENTEFTPLSDTEVKSVLTDLLQKRYYVSYTLFGSGVEMEKEGGQSYNVYGCMNASRAIVTDPNYKNIEDVQAVVESVYTKSTANKMYQLNIHSNGYKEYLFMDGVTQNIFGSMYTEENGKFYYYYGIDKSKSFEYDYNSLEVTEQTKNTITLTLDIEFGETTDKAEVTLKKENEKWLIDNYNGIF